MGVRRVFYRWLLPAAFVLPLWLFLGWLIFSRSGLALIPTLVVFMPAVFVAQLALTLIVRTRPSVRAEKAVSWADVGAFTAWHVLTIAVGVWPPLFGLVLALAIVAALGTFWLTLWELWTDSRAAWSVGAPMSAEQRERLREQADLQRERTIIVAETQSEAARYNTMNTTRASGGMGPW
ncbi:hypothetical protein [Microbacterium gorillae]|uniref:hypothetical protein n=1 Tax=Microbacterium gorillae TaxID=1231063 RepID=UPI0006948121|nr:hypothetical protein [Microbacterium gorillae]